MNGWAIFKTRRVKLHQKVPAQNALLQRPTMFTICQNLISLNFPPPSLFSTGRRRIQRRPGGRLQRLAVRKDFQVGKVGDEILAHFHAKSTRHQNKSSRARFQNRSYRMLSLRAAHLVKPLRETAFRHERFFLCGYLPVKQTARHRQQGQRAVGRDFSIGGLCGLRRLNGLLFRPALSTLSTPSKLSILPMHILHPGRHVISGGGRAAIRSARRASSLGHCASPRCRKKSS